MINVLHSTASGTAVVDGATHMGLVTSRAHAQQTAAVILQIVEAARRTQMSGQSRTQEARGAGSSAASRAAPARSCFGAGGRTLV